MSMSLKEIWNRQSYAGGTPSAAELLVWSYRYHRATGLRVDRYSLHSRGALAVDAIKEARREAAAGKTRYLSSLPAGYGTSGKPFSAYGSKHMRFIESSIAAGLRFVGYADKIAELQHTGWYLQNGDYNESVRGVIFRMAARNGVERFVGGYEDPWNGKADSDGPVCLDFSDIRDSERDAAYAADSIAERMAKTHREYDAAWQAGSQYAGLGEVISDSRAEIKESISLFRQLRRDLVAASIDVAKYGKLCATIRGDVRKELDSIAEARAERARLREGDWISERLPGWNSNDSNLVAAFNDGAGIAA